MKFDISKKESGQKIMSIDADNFKQAITEFANLYDILDQDNYIASHDGSKIDIRYVFPSSNIYKHMPNILQSNFFEFQRKNEKGSFDKIYAVFAKEDIENPLNKQKTLLS